MTQPDTEWAMQMLFTAKWNIPQAAEAQGLKATERDWELVKAQFAEYCKEHKQIWAPSE